jgi:hypothetical protein
MTSPALLTPSLAPSLARLDSLIEWASFAYGRPSDRDEGWYRVEAFLNPGIRTMVLERMLVSPYAGSPKQVVGNYLFRDVIGYPLSLAGYLFMAERRVPVLSHNTMVHCTERLDGLRLLETRAFVLPKDPWASQPDIEVLPNEQALTDTLFSEVRRTCEPLIRAFRVEKLVASANAWGSILDSLAYGFEHAGRYERRLDAAWLDWTRTIAGRSFPTRHRPRRFQYEIEGESGECWIRAGCCLWYTTTEAKNDPEQRYCGTCRLMPDNERLRLLSYYQQNRADEPGSAS